MSNSDEQRGRNEPNEHHRTVKEVDETPEHQPGNDPSDITPKRNPKRKRSGLFCTASSRPCRQRRLRRRLGGRSGPSAPLRKANCHGRVRALEFISFGSTPHIPNRIGSEGGKSSGCHEWASRPAAGHPANSIMRMWRGAPAAALKGPLRRPPAALDRCLSRVVPYAPYEAVTTGIGPWRRPVRVKGRVLLRFVGSPQTASRSASARLLSPAHPYSAAVAAAVLMRFRAFSMSPSPRRARQSSAWSS